MIGEERPRPYIGGELVLGDADPSSFEVLRPGDPVLAHIDRGVAEGARQEGRHADIGAIARGGLDGEARERELADIERRLAKGAEEDLLRAERHDDRVDAVDLDRAVDQRPGPIVVSDGYGQGELGHRSWLLRNRQRDTRARDEGTLHRFLPEGGWPILNSPGPTGG